MKNKNTKKKSEPINDKEQERLKAVKSAETEIKVLNNKFGIHKINLIHENGGAEGIWCTPLSAEDRKKLESDTSVGEKVYVRLMNQPFGWGNACWGGFIVGKTRGQNRPEARLPEQRELDDKNVALIQAMYVKVEDDDQPAV